MSEVAAQFRALFRGGGETLVYTMRDLNQRLSHIMSEIQATGSSAFITRHGRFIAVITPLAPGQVESRVLDEMAREIGRRSYG
jgi:prevent-host-death family protein